MKRFGVALQIQAPAARIWSILTDAASYPRWNTTVSKVDGTIAPGEKIALHVRINPGRAFPVRVSVFEPPHRMLWTGGMPLGMFKGERTFRLAPQPGGSVEFSMVEEFTGLLEPLISKSIPNLQPAFDEFALCLKREAERQEGAADSTGN